MLRSLKTTVSCIALALAVSNAALAADHMNMAPAPSSTQSTSESAANTSPSTVANAKVANNNQDQTAEKRKQITAEAIAAVGETRNALKALDEGKKDDALAALEKTTGKPRQADNDNDEWDWITPQSRTRECWRDIIADENSMSHAV